MSPWIAVALVTEGLALAAWAFTHWRRQVRLTFLVGFNALLPVAAVHLFLGAEVHWRTWLGLALVVVYLARMNVVLLAWTGTTALSKLDAHLTTAEKHVLPFVMTNGAGWAYALPFHFVAQRTGPFDAQDGVAIAVYVVGSALHLTADWQKRRFKARAGTRGQVLDRGLWRFSRHPNYFGDTLVYASWAVLAASPWAWIAPAAALLQYAFDAMPKNEAWAKKAYGAAWDEYARRTSRFVPLPPRR